MEESKTKALMEKTRNLNEGQRNMNKREMSF